MAVGGYRSDVDGLRALAVLPVVSFHAYPWSLPGGFTGVDIFFVISGYLICGIIFAELREQRFTFGKFYQRRIRRIFPALVLVLIATLSAGYWTMLPEELAVLGRHIAAGAGFVLNFVLASETGYFDQAAEAKPLLHLWSLAIEEQFYLIWPLVAFAIWKLTRSAAASIALILAIIAASFVANIVLTASDAGTSYFLPQARFCQLMTGGALAHFDMMRQPGSRWDAAWFRNIRSIVGVVLVVAGFFLIRGTYPGWWALLPTLGAAAIISAGKEAIPNRLLLSSRPAVAVGLISYPLYLWHWPLLSFARIIGLPERYAGVELVAVAIAFLLSWGTFEFVEKPIRFGKRLPARPVVTLLPVSLALVAVIGWAGYRSEGWPDRIPESLRQVADFKYDFADDYRFHTCFIASDAAKIEFASECTSAARPSIMLWGDSHSAHLRPGIDSLAKEMGYGVRQISLSGCVPSIGPGQSKVCAEVNERTFEQIKSDKPDILVVAGYWKNIGFWDFAVTLQALARLENVKVIVVGPVPIWNLPVPRLLYLQAIRSGTDEIAGRTWFQRDHIVDPIDAEMRRMTEQAGLRYVSALDLLCNEAGCETFKSGMPLQWDKEHFTRAGSLNFVGKLAGEIAAPAVTQSAGR